MEENIFGAEKQKRLKIISKIIYIVAKIAKIVTIIGVAFAILGTLLGFTIASKIELSTRNDNEITVKVFGNNIDIKREDGKFAITTGSSWIKVTDINSSDFDELVEIAKKFSTEKMMLSLAGVITFSIAAMIIYVLILDKVEKIFKNINEGPTPFTLENVGLIKKIVYFMIAVTVLSIFGNLIISIVFNGHFSMGFDIMRMLVIYCIAYVFEYGYKIQQQTQAKLYDETKE